MRWIDEVGAFANGVHSLILLGFSFWWSDDRDCIDGDCHLDHDDRAMTAELSSPQSNGNVRYNWRRLLADVVIWIRQRRVCFVIPLLKVSFQILDKSRPNLIWQWYTFVRSFLKALFWIICGLFILILVCTRVSFHKTSWFVLDVFFFLFLGRVHLIGRCRGRV